MIRFDRFSSLLVIFCMENPILQMITRKLEKWIMLKNKIEHIGGG
jgi:hypothetical protein